MNNGDFITANTLLSAGYDVFYKILLEHFAGDGSLTRCSVHNLFLAFVLQSNKITRQLITTSTMRLVCLSTGSLKEIKKIKKGKNWTCEVKFLSKNPSGSRESVHSQFEGSFSALVVQLKTAVIRHQFSLLVEQVPTHTAELLYFFLSSRPNFLSNLHW